MSAQQPEDGTVPTVTTIPGSLRIGAIVSRDERLVKNARWYVASGAGVTKVGWGDLSVADLERIRGEIGRQVFIAVAEAPRATGSATGPWNSYDQPDSPPGPTIDALCSDALCAVLSEGGGVVVDTTFVTGEMVELLNGHRLRAMSAADLQSVVSALRAEA